MFFDYSLAAIVTEYRSEASPEPAAGQGREVKLDLVGAAFLVFLPQWAQDISKAPGVPSVIYGGVLILLMMVLPSGFGGLTRRLTGPLTSRLYRRS